MREFKFRVWDTEDKLWLGDREYSLENNNHLILYSSVFEIIDTFYCGADDSRFIIQQYTGLKDSQGNEVYEGDIVEWETGRESVTFDNGVFWVDLPLYEVNKICKVVGNINETLLN